MNGEIPSVPITTLAGVSSLTDLLPELPLPTPLVPVGNKSLLFHPKIAEDARRILNTKDENLVSQLVHALQQTSTDHIELKDSLAGDAIEGDVPELLRAILAQDPQAFKGGPKYNTANNSGSSNGSHHHLVEAASAAQQSDISQTLPVPHNSFQQQFLQFTGTDGPTVNGGSPSIQTASTPPHGGADRNRQQQKPSTVSSPAQASAAPLPVDSPGQFPTTAGQFPTAMGQAPTAEPGPSAVNEPLPQDASSSAELDTPEKRLAAREPMVVIEPLDVKSFTEETRRKQSSVKSGPVVQLEDLNVLLDGTRKNKKKPQFEHYNVVSSSGSEHKLTLKLSKTRNEEEKRGTKRRRSDDDEPQEGDESAMMDLEAAGDGADFAPSLSERVKRRRRQVTYKEDDSGDEGNNAAGGDGDFRPSKSRRKTRDRDPDFMNVDDDVPEVVPRGEKTSRAYVAAAMAEAMKKKKERRQKLQQEAMMMTDGLVESNTYKRFSALIETVMESAENADPADLNIEDEDDIVGLGGQETLISKPVLVDLCNEAAKLKALGGMNKIPYEKLVKLLTLLQYSIKDGCKVIPLLDDDSHDHAKQLLRDLNVDRVLCAADASLTALYVMTAADMPKEVYIEDVIDRVVRMARLQMQNTIYPEFDPVYRVDPKNKSGYQANMKMKRARASGVRSKSTLLLYNKLTEVVENLAELINIQQLTDTIILQTSTLAVSAFFVENISELQLDSLKLVTNVFAKYEKHRQLIIEDILASLARLPSSKKNLRNYRLNADEQIQMVTALALELIQCVVRLPQQDGDEDTSEVDNEVVIVTSYETAMRTAHNFLAVFLFKCAQKGEENYRPLFENFVFDLLSTVNKPEWPAAELLLSLLGRLLVKQFSNKSVDMSLRVASLDYLGIVAARLRKDAVSSRLNEDVISEIINHIREEEAELADAVETRTQKKGKGSKSEQSEEDHRMECLQQALLEYLVHNTENDPALVFARRFYIGQWYRDATLECERAVKQQQQEKQKPKKSDEDEDDDDDEEGREKPVDKAAEEFERLQDLQQCAEKRKNFLQEQMKIKIGAFANFKPSPSRMDYDSACLVTRYLASTRPFSQSFDIYLTQILKVLCETAVAVRTKAMKCLTAVVEADPGILARSDMQRGVHGRFLDHSTSVREAAVELVGKFILIRPELTEQYYDMLSERILDTGISVRKRVIKIFRDICLDQTDFPRIPDMCVKMIRRVNDEEGIKKLVNDTFQNMWFSPQKDNNEAKLLRRVMNITDVVAACRETGVDWFEQLLENLLKKEEDAAQKPVEKACTQLINCLVENVLVLEEKETTERRGTCNSRQVACFATLYLFCKVKPELLVRHVPMVQPYLEIRCISPTDYMVLHNVARILELAVPLMEHPSESFLAQLEEDMMKLVLRHGMTVLQSCVSCLGSIVNNVTHNFKLVRDCFQKFFGVLSKFMQEHQRDPHSPQLVSNKPTLLRSLFTVGLLCRHFDFDGVEFGEKKVSIRERVFDVLMYFIKHEDEDVRHKAMTGLGLHAVRHYELMLGKELRELYQKYLTSTDVSERLCCQVLKNIQTYLTEEEVRMIKADHEWRKTRDKEDLKEMGDVQSGMASAVIQVYIKQILESFFHSQYHVRFTALNCITLIMRQGLVHPVQCIPYLISMGTDYDSQVRIKADSQIKEVDKKYPGFIQMKAMQGIKMSYRLQTILQADPTTPVRGYRTESANGNGQTSIIALNNFIYGLIRVNRNQRRAVLGSILNMFDDSSKVPLSELLYMADNLAHFPYTLHDEPLYIIHQVDILVSVSGSNIIQSFKELLYPENYPKVAEEELTVTTTMITNEDGEEVEVVSKPPPPPPVERRKLDDDEDEDIEELIAKIPENVSELHNLYFTSQSCVLLLMLKSHLKDTYGFTDNKIQRYSPTDNAKIWDRPMTRKHTAEFNPKQVIDVLKKLPLPTTLDDDQKRELLENYLEFKQLMLSIDPDEDDDDEDAPPKSGQQTPAAAGNQTPVGAGGGAQTDTPPKEGGERPEGAGASLVPGQDPATTSQNVSLMDCTVDLTKDIDEDAQEKMQSLSVTMPSSQKLSITITSDRKRSSSGTGISSSHHSSSSSHSHHHSSHSHSRSHSHHKQHKSHKHGKHKKKKKKKRHSDTEDDSDEGEDSDFVP